MSPRNGAKIKMGPEYKYQDPRSGDEVAMRLADQRPSTINNNLSFTNVEISNTKVQVKNDIINVSLDKTEMIIDKPNTDKAKTSAPKGHEHFELSGPLDKNLTAKLVDTHAINGISGMKAYAECVGIDVDGKKTCSELYVNLYFYLDGELRTRQFAVKNYSTAAHETRQPALPLTPEKAAAPDAAAQGSETEETHGVEEEFVESDNSHFVTPKLDDKFYSDLKKDVVLKTDKETDKKTDSKPPQPKPIDTKPSGQKTTPVKIDADHSTTVFSNLLLTGGGQSFKLTQNGRIINGPATLLPRQSDGLLRVSGDSKAWGTGYSVSFLESAAHEFVRSHQACGPVVVRNVSKETGGPMLFDSPTNGHSRSASHQNGLDFDLAYLTLPDLTSVVHGQSTTKDFAAKCNYDWIKFLANSTLPDREYITNVIFVHTAVLKSLCQYKNQNHLNSPSDEQVENVLYATSDAHDNHMHVRLNCSPEHAGCENTFPQATGCL